MSVKAHLIKCKKFPPLRGNFLCGPPQRYNSLFPGKILYIALFLLTLIDIVWILTARIGVDLGELLDMLIPATLITMLIAVLRGIDAYVFQKLPLDSRDTWSRSFRPCMACMEGLFFILIAEIVLPIFNYLTMSLDLPYADKTLLEAERYLPLDWNVYFRFVAERSFLSHASDWLYSSLMPACIIAFIGLIAMQQTGKAQFLIASFFTTAVICIMAGAFFPARGAVLCLLDDPTVLTHFAKKPGVYHMPYMNMLRGTGPIVLTPGHMPGLVTFPSFHTAAGVVLAWSYRGTRLFWPMIVYNAAMIATTPVIGGHYFIDLLSGMIVAIAVLMTIERITGKTKDDRLGG